MKNIGVKKLAAIAAGAALLGTAMAPFAIAAVSDLTKADFYADSGSPIVNVVVGNTAKISDVIWAGNIASKLAEKATTTAPATAGLGTADVNAAEIAVEVGGGSTTYSNAKVLEGYLVSATTPLENAFDKNVAISSAGVITGTSLTSSALPDLIDKTLTYKYNGANTNITVKERIAVAPNPSFKTTLSSERMALDVEGGAFSYVLDLGAGIPSQEIAGSTGDFADDTNDNVLVPFFGKNYLVKAIGNTAGSEYIQMVETNAKKTLLPGESIEVDGKGTYAGKKLTLVVDSLLVTPASNAKFILKDGDTVLDTVTQGTGELDFQDGVGNDIMDTAVNIDAVANTGSNNTTGVTNGYVDMFVGSSGLTIYDAKGYPYDPNDTDSIYDWKAALYFSAAATSTSRTLKAVKIYNSAKNWADEKSLAVGETAEFVTGGYKIKFQGWKGDKSRTTVKIGGEKLEYKDSSGTPHVIPFYVKSPSYTPSSDSNNYTSLDYTFDAKYNYFIDVNETDQNIFISTGDTVNGRVWDINGDSTNGAGDAVANIPFLSVAGIGRVATDLNTGTSFTVDGVTYTLTADHGDAHSGRFRTDGRLRIRRDSATGSLYTCNGGAIACAIGDSNSTFQYIYYTDAVTFDTNLAQSSSVSISELEGAGSQYYEYAVRVRETDNKAWFLLNDQLITAEFSGNAKTINFLGTDLNEDNIIEGSAMKPRASYTNPFNDGNTYYVPDDDAFGATGAASDNDYFVALFQVDSGNGQTSGNADAVYDFNEYITTKVGDGKVVTLPNSNLTTYSAQVTRAAIGSSSTAVQALTMRSDSPENSNYYSEAYDDTGVLVKITDGVVSYSLPETAEYMQAIVQSAGTTEIPVNGEPGVLKVGQTVKIGDVSIQVKAITGVTVTGGTGDAGTIVVPALLNGKATVVGDNADPGAAILVGGQKVNRLTKALGVAVSSKLAKSTDYIVEKVGNKVVVAGYTATDTGTAALELITFLSGLQ